MAVLVHLYAPGFGMARPSTGHVRSHDAATCCRASTPACKPHPRSHKMRKNENFGMFFQHPYTSVNGVGKRDINIHNSPSAIVPIVAHLCSFQARPDDTRDVAAPAVHRFLRIPSLIIHDKAGSDSCPKLSHRLSSQYIKGL